MLLDVKEKNEKTEIKLVFWNCNLEIGTTIFKKIIPKLRSGVKITKYINKQEFGKMKNFQN